MRLSYRVISGLIGLTFMPLGIYAQEIASASRIDWRTNTFEMALSVDVDRADGLGANSMFRAQTQLDQSFPGQLFDSLLPLPVDSRQRIQDAVQNDPDLASRIASLALGADRDVPVPAHDLSEVSRSYNIALFPDVSSLFVTHTVPFQMERLVRWVPTRDYSGVVIYAADALPLHGTGTNIAPPSTTHIVPALLPQIYDTNLRPVLEQDMMFPDSIARWGVALYTQSAEPDDWRERAGAQPLHIMARGLFGSIPSDVIISPDDADRLLASDHNRTLLRQGRIVIVVPDSQYTTFD